MEIRHEALEMLPRKVVTNLGLADGAWGTRKDCIKT